MKLSSAKSMNSTLTRKISNGTLLALVSAAAFTLTAQGSVIDTPKGFVLRSNVGIALAGNVHVGGKVGAVGQVTTGSGTSTDGVETGAVHTWTSPVITSWTAPAGVNVDLDKSEVRSLTAGSYDKFTSKISSTLNLGSGVYTFSKFDLGASGKVVADTSAGDVYVYVSGAFAADGQTKFQTTGAGKLFLVALGNMTFGNQAEINAAIYGSGGVSFAGNTNLTGLVYAGGNLIVGSGSNFTFSNVPAPGVSALLAVAGIIGGRRRRRLDVL
ncbi:MAG: hypothetical protein K8R92_11015 [Planctomycetes bacterium]|nr:hypothetical protein [Planctomycetota bacterium]